jgi:hypothetical protein
VRKAGGGGSDSTVAAKSIMPRRKVKISDETWRIWRLLDPSVSFGRVWTELNEHRSREAASATIDALMYSLRCGINALSDPNTLGRLAKLDERQLIDVAARLQKFKSEIAPAWLPDQIEIIAAVWRKLHERR